MAVITTSLVCDLQEVVKVSYLSGNLFSQDNQANVIKVTVLDGGQPATISGTVTASIIRQDGGTVTATGGTITDNVASITLPSAAYVVPGLVSIVVKLTSSGVITTLAAVVTNVYQSTTETAIDPGTIIPSVTALISAIDTAVASIPADYSALWTTLAPAFDTSASYVAGQYVTYNGGLYRFNTAHSGEWVAADVVSSKVGTELSNIIEKMLVPVTEPRDWAKGLFNASGQHYAGNAWIRTDTKYGFPNGTFRIEVEEGYLLRVWAWDTNGTYKGVLHSNGAISTTASNYGDVRSFDCRKYPTYLYKVAFRRDPSSADITTAEGSKCKYYTTNTDKTLTIDGKAADAKATGERLYEFNYKADRPESEVAGDVVSFVDKIGNLPLKKLNVDILFVQTGEGEPSPDNARPVTGYTGATVYHSPTTETQDATVYNVTFPESAGTVYGGTLDLVSGLLTVDTKMINAGSVAYTYTNGVFRANNNYTVNATLSRSCCTHYKNTANSPTNAPDKSIAYKSGYWDSKNRIFIKDSRFTDVDTFKAWCTENGVKIVTQFEPVTYQLSPLEVLTLVGQNYVWSDMVGVSVVYMLDNETYVKEIAEQEVGAVAEQGYLNWVSATINSSGSIYISGDKHAVSGTFVANKVAKMTTLDGARAQVHCYAIDKTWLGKITSAELTMSTSSSASAYNFVGEVPIKAITEKYPNAYFMRLLMPVSTSDTTTNRRLYGETHISVKYQFDEIAKRMMNARWVSNNTNEIPPLTLLHISDIHANSLALQRINNKVVPYAHYINGKICTGDLVNNVAGSISGWWDASYMTVIGNHDTRIDDNWTALPIADRIAQYIAPFESGWGIVREEGNSYYYKDYASSKIRLIVLDNMIYVSGGTDATNQNTWLGNTIDAAMTLGYHVLIAIHAPSDQAVAFPCTFSGATQTVYNGNPSICVMPQSVIDIVAAKIELGCNFIGYITGHTHRDTVWKATEDGRQLIFCITCATYTQNSDQAREVDRTQITTYGADEFDPSEGAYYDAANLITIDTVHSFVKIVRVGGADMDIYMRPRKAICFRYSDGTMLGEVK